MMDGWRAHADGEKELQTKGGRNEASRTHGAGGVAAAVERGVRTLPCAAGVHAGDAGGGGCGHDHRRGHQQEPRLHCRHPSLGPLATGTHAHWQ
jgi:hypothetical protein